MNERFVIKMRYRYNRPTAWQRSNTGLTEFSMMTDEKNHPI